MRMRLNHRNAGNAKIFTVVFSVLLLSHFGLGADIHAQPSAPGIKSTPTVLHISVTVMPTVQAASLAPPAPQTGQVVYRLENPPREQLYETRVFPSDARAQLRSERPAILKTLVVVPQ
jgi:hypothetical protein